MKATKITVSIFYFICFILLTSASIPEQTLVPANVAWTKTTYKLNVGDRLEITSNGEITPLELLNCHPSGIANNLDLQSKYGVIKTANFGCLIGKIGENGIPFVIGDHLNVIADIVGVLYLGINDNELKDNKGEFISIVTITPIAVKTDSTSK